MARTLLCIAFVIAFIGAGIVTPSALAQVQNYKPVTAAELANPSPNDWLSFSRTYDDQRFSPLNQITRQNVNQLRMAWSRGTPAGTVESTPLVRGGTMYIMTATGGVMALNATNGDLLWEYTRPQPPAPAAPAAGAAGGGRGAVRAGGGRGAPARVYNSRSKTFSIFDDLIFYTAPDSNVVGLDARTGELRWQSRVDNRGNSSGTIMAGDKVISGGSGCGTRASCYISAHDAHTGKELWKFYTTPAAGEPGGDSWADVPDERRVASTWGSPGAYDPVRDIVYYGIANPTPNSRIARHNGNPFAIPTSAPSALYSNSTVALDGKTGKLLWYFQHLPGDDWDEDWTNERTLIHTKVNPNPQFVKWINPKIKPGEERDTIFAAGESGGIFLLDRLTGEFLWANPFPYDAPNFWLKNVDVNTGKTYLNEDLIFRNKGEEKIICFFNTRSYWPAAYSPLTNSMYVPYIDVCLDNIEGGQRKGVARAGADPQKLNGIGKINMETGEILRFGEQRAPANGAVLATAGNLIFWGDLDRRLHAFDAETGKQLWEGIVGGSIAVSTITYAVNGKQYVAILTGDGALGPGLVTLHAPEIKRVAGHNAVYVFALP
ncbi:MAG: PQQ-binding-like beta-propeller repeat protein [Acidobacteriia bacterium]|nr:PQQ-binding-like beta-propeller repeat protein [Terriglobia bacterium]